MKEVQITSLADLIHLSKTWMYKTTIMCRGVTDAGYQLIPKIGRDETRAGGYSKILEQHIFSEFVRQARPYLEFVPQHESDWLALAQHHGLPTRLLDWSTSILVALYFSVEKAPVFYGAKDAAIYVRDLHKTFTTIDKPFEQDGVVGLIPHHISRRIVAQGGLFTLHSNPAIPLDDETITKIIIPGDCFYNLKTELDVLAGINAVGLFPDLDGLSRHLTWEYKMKSS